MYAAADPRVAGIVLSNPWARSEQIAAATRVRHYYFRRMISAAISGARCFAAASVCAAVCRSLPVRCVARCATGRGRSHHYLQRMHDGLARFRGPVLCVLCGNDFTAREFEAWADQQSQRRALLSDPASRSTVRMPPTIRFPTRHRAMQCTTKTIEWITRLRSAR